MPLYNQNGSTKTVSASTTVTFAANEIAGPGVMRYLLFLTTSTVADISRVRVKRDGVSLLDLPIDHLRSYISRLSRSNRTIATTDTSLEIPLSLIDGIGSEQEACQFGDGAPTVELVIPAGATTGTVLIGWEMSELTPAFTPRNVSVQSNIGASSTNGRIPVNVQPDSVLRSITIPTGNLDRARLVLGGKQMFDLEGTGLLAFAQADGGGMSDPATIVIDPTPAPVGSYLEISTAAGWSTGDEISLGSLVPQTPANS